MKRTEATPLPETLGVPAINTLQFTVVARAEFREPLEVGEFEIRT